MVSANMTTAIMYSATKDPARINSATTNFATLISSAIDSTTMYPQNGLHNIRPEKWAMSSITLDPAIINLRTIVSATIDSTAINLALMNHATKNLAKRNSATMDTTQWTSQQRTLQQWTPPQWNPQIEPATMTSQQSNPQQLTQQI